MYFKSSSEINTTCSLLVSNIESTTIYENYYLKKIIHSMIICSKILSSNIAKDFLRNHSEKIPNEGQKIDYKKLIYNQE